MNSKIKTMMLTMAVLKATKIKTVGLCHSVQVCVPDLFKGLGIQDDYDLNDFQWKIAGINHMAWLLEINYQGEDFYPVIRQIHHLQSYHHADIRFHHNHLLHRHWYP